MRYTSKSELLADIVKEHDALQHMLQRLPEAHFSEPDVWGSGWTVGDLVAHLAEWHRMFLRWFREGEDGGQPALPAPGYKWNETPRLNRDIWEKHRGREYSVVNAEFEATYREILDLLTRLPEAAIFEAGQYQWTGKNGLVTYVGANTASHYRFAQKAVKRLERRIREEESKESQ
jgi:hypothetical protein